MKGAINQQKTAPFTAHWFLGKQYLGASGADHILIHGQFHPPESILRICPVCGEVWSRIIMEPATRFHPVTRKCPEHGMGVIGLYDNSIPLPLEALKYEIQQLNPYGEAYETFLITGGL